MLSVEDILDTLLWVERVGGLNELFNRSDKSLQYISKWIENNPSFEFMNLNEQTRSNTGITFQIKENWFKNMNEVKQKQFMSQIASLLAKEKIANDINGYPKAPPSFRVWGGGTVEPRDVQKLLPWIKWAVEEIKLQFNE